MIHQLIAPSRPQSADLFKTKIRLKHEQASEQQDQTMAFKAGTRKNPPDPGSSSRLSGRTLVIIKPDAIFAETVTSFAQ